MGKDRQLRAFKIHLSAFALIVAALAAFNLYSNPQKPWFVWVLAGWGIGVAAHGLALLLKRTALGGAIFVDEKVRGFVIHLFVFVGVNALLVVVNLRYTPDFSWFLFPLPGWGVGLLAHGIAVFRRR
jgi:predicted membrane channel-forming protein YqfA (hemolysin III family)